MSQLALQFYRSSAQGRIIKRVSVNPAECKKLAADVNAEAMTLSEVEEPLAKALKENCAT
jgi:hypothetical protein